MTNGEKIQTILDVDRDCTEVHGENGTMTFTVTQNFWNTEYKEPKIDTWSIKEVADALEKHGLIREQEPCEDCISRKAALEAFGLSEKSREYGGDYSGYDILMKYEIQDILEALPPVTPQQKIGHWKRVELGMFDSVSIRWECSECKKSDRFRSNFCFNCGAKMESEVQE